MEAYLLYQSRTGTTKRMAENMAAYLNEKGVTTTVDSIQEANKEKIIAADILFLGCWTHGLMVVLQHPDKEWVSFAKSLEGIENKKVVLFATYKLLTGSMFKKMEKTLEDKKVMVAGRLKTKFGKLNDPLIRQLDQIANQQK